MTILFKESVTMLAFFVSLQVMQKKPFTIYCVLQFLEREVLAMPSFWPEEFFWPRAHCFQQVALEIFPRSPPLSASLENSLPSVGVSWGNKALQNTSVILFAFPVLIALMVMNDFFFFPHSVWLLNCYLTPFYFKILAILQYSKNICKIHGRETM